MPNGNCEYRSEYQIAMDCISDAKETKKAYYELLVKYQEQQRVIEKLKILLGDKVVEAELKKGS